MYGASRLSGMGYQRKKRPSGSLIQSTGLLEAIFGRHPFRKKGSALSGGSEYQMFVRAYSRSHPNLKGPRLIQSAAAAWRARKRGGARVFVKGMIRHQGLLT
jgi:hypothetical protein